MVDITHSSENENNPGSDAGLQPYPMNAPDECDGLRQGTESDPPIWPAHVGRASQPQLCATVARLVDHTSWVYLISVFFTFGVRSTVSSQ